MVLKFKYNAKDSTFQSFEFIFNVMKNQHKWNISKNVHIIHEKSMKKIDILGSVMLKLVSESFDYGKTVFDPFQRGRRTILLVPVSFLCHFNRRCPHRAVIPLLYNAKKH